MKILPLFTFFLLSSCVVGDWKAGTWNIGLLCAQKIEGTSKVLYKYDAWGGRDSESSGFVILDSTEKFQVNTSRDLPFIYLLETPTKTNIIGVSADYQNSSTENYEKEIPIFTPIKRENSKKQDVNIANIVYQYKGFAERSGGLETFQFKRFNETRDSLLFYDLDDVESMNGKHLDTLKLKKTDVCILQNTKHEIIKIVLKDLIVDKKTFEIVSNVQYHLTPIDKLNSNKFSDYGIFKQIIQ